MKTPTTSAFYSDPQIQFLSQILQDIKRGELLVPRFQRPFVWQPSQQLELLRSIRQGIPIGAIMVWRTANSQIACYETLGPFALEPGRGVGVRDYLLDGVQRLSTLYGALNSPSTATLATTDEEEVEEDEEEEQLPLRIFFDLKKLDFLFSKLEDEVLAYWLPLNILLDSVALLRYQRTLSSYADAERMVEECDYVAGAFRQYKVPIIPIATDNLSLATLTFQRINSQGQKMSDYHMLHALTWSTSFDLMRSLKLLRIEYLNPVGWEEIDEDPILKVLKLILGLDVYKADIEELSKKVRSYPTALESAVHGVSLTANFLRNELDIPSHEFVPYSLQIVLLSEVLRNFPDLDRAQIELLKNWFWYVAYSEAFSGISDDKVRVALEDMRTMLLVRKPVWRNKNTYQGVLQLSRFDFRAVRTKNFILSMARSQAVLEDGHPPSKLLIEYGRRAIQPFFPASAFSTNDRKLLGALGNKVLCAPSDLAGLRKLGPAEILRRMSDELPGHVQLQVFDTPESFVSFREQWLLEKEAAFANRTAGEFSRVLSLD